MQAGVGRWRHSLLSNERALLWRLYGRKLIITLGFGLACLSLRKNVSDRLNAGNVSLPTYLQDGSSVTWWKSRLNSWVSWVSWVSWLSSPPFRKTGQPPIQQPRSYRYLFLFPDTPIAWTALGPVQTQSSTRQSHAHHYGEFKSPLGAREDHQSPVWRMEDLSVHQDLHHIGAQAQDLIVTVLLAPLKPSTGIGVLCLFQC